VSVASFCPSTLAQESISAQEGFEVGKQAGIAIAICFGILASIILVVNAIRWKFPSLVNAPKGHE